MMMAACGIDCAACPVYVATSRNDDQLRLRTASQWSTELNMEIKASELNCLGCRSDLVYGHCQRCEIRTCDQVRAEENCSDCSAYPCDRLSKFLANAPRERARLDELHGRKPGK